MGWEAWFTLAVVIAVLALLASERVLPSLVMVGGMVAVLVAGVVSPGQALAGFSNPAPATVAALYVLARAVEKTGALGPLTRSLMGRNGRQRRVLARLMFPTAGASAFLNNTPIVAMMVPQVVAWADEQRQSPSHYLMPLSYAALLGGLITAIGTSTNLVVSGLMEQAGHIPIGFFEIGMVGAPVALIGLIVILVWAPRALTPRRSPRQEVEEGGRHFVVDMLVEKGGPYDGVTVEAGQLRNLRGVFLASLERDGDLIAPVTPDTRLRAEDRLRFAGRADDVLDLETRRGLVVASADLYPSDAGRYFETVIGATSPLVGSTLKEAGFRSRYQAAVLAIHRAGSLVEGKLGGIRMRVGDTLLIVADPGFQDRWRDSGEFLLVSPLRSRPTSMGRRTWLVAVVVMGLILAASLGVLPILQASLVAAAVLVLGGVLTPSEARHSVDLDVVVLIASAFGVAAAVSESGLAQRAADLMASSLSFLGQTGLLAGVLIATTLMTSVVSNNASALMMFPIAASAAATAGLDPRGFFMAVAVGASIDFITPIGYQTNTMVWGPGGYRFGDYSRLGLPVTVVAILISVVVIPWAWPLSGS